MLSEEQDHRLSGLMAQAQSGDKAAYNRLLEESVELLRRYLLSRTENREAAEDVVQDTLVSIHRARHTFRAGEPFAPWMYAIARYRLADHWRSQARRVVCTPIEDQLNVAEAPHSSPWGEHVKEALNELPDKQRHVVELLKVQGLSLKEAAAKLQMSEGAVKVAAHRAYNRLRRQFMDVARGHE